MKNKKVLLSSILIVVFAVYVAIQRIGGSNDIYITSSSNGGKQSLALGPSNQTPASQTPVSVPNGESVGNSPQVTNPNPAPVTTPAKGQTPVNASGYKDGQYTGSVADAYYGNIQVQVTIQGGKITDVQFLDYPHDRGTSVRINTQAMPVLKQEAIQAQSANVDVVSGATQTSGAFNQSLASALLQAKS